MSRLSARFALVAAIVLGLFGVAIGVSAPVSAATACAPTWSASSTYVAGGTASQDGINYQANWWTRGDAPASHNGTVGTGQPWSVAGACGTTPSPVPTASPAPTASPSPSPSPTTGTGSCAAAWTPSAVYLGGQSASRNGVNFQANWWTQGDDPAIRNGGVGTGAPWTVQSVCSTSSTPTPAPTTSPSPTVAPTPTPTPTPTPAPSPSGSTGTASGFVFSPYKDVTVNMNWNTYAMNTAVTGSVKPVVGTDGLLTSTLPSLHALTLAFATGACGSENWGGVPAQSFRDANIPPLDAANVDYIVSTGGAAGSFTCASTAGMRAFIDRYTSTNLIGIDFDIEAGQTAADVKSLVAAVKGVQSSYPKLRFSFTIATLAASTGGGVNAAGDAVVREVLAAGITNYTINLMAMDYGAPGPYICVVSGGVCDMGQSAIQAAKNLQQTYGIPLSHIELTPMIGLNDVVSETFTLQDADTMTAYAKANGLAGIHFWSLDRDTPCATSSAWASTTCNSVPTGTAPLSYTKRFLAAIG